MTQVMQMFPVFFSEPNNWSQFLRRNVPISSSPTEAADVYTSEKSSVIILLGKVRIC